jgi:hypothetical protein
MREFYTMYDADLAEWIAGLYDPRIGGFYYSQSARDNKTTVYNEREYTLLPDLESTLQALGIVGASGMTEGRHYSEFIPEWMKNQIADFTYSLQDPDGFFYHPQWGKNIGIGRRCRDYDRSLILLGRYGRRPKYPTMSDGGEGGDILIPDNMKTLEAFKEYLATLDLDHRSYNVGSVLSEQISTLKTRGPEYIETLAEFFNSHQREDNGIWHEKCDYYGSNGLMKIAGAYTKMNKPIPNPEKAMQAAIAAIMSPEDPDSIVTVWNPWVSVKGLLLNINKHHSPELAKKLRGELYRLAPEAIRITKEKTLKFKKPDGSFSYLQAYSTWTMQGAPCAIPRTVEGDMDAGVLGTNSMVWVISNALGVPEEYGVPLFGEYESAVFKAIMDNRKPVRK